MAGISINADAVAMGASLLGEIKLERHACDDPGLLCGSTVCSPGNQNSIFSE